MILKHLKSHTISRIHHKRRKLIILNNYFHNTLIVFKRSRIIVASVALNVDTIEFLLSIKSVRANEIISCTLNVDVQLLIRLHVKQ